MPYVFWFVRTFGMCFGLCGFGSVLAVCVLNLCMLKLWKNFEICS